MKFFVFLTVLVASSLASPIEDVGRIVGGKDAKRGDYPFIVSLQLVLSTYPEQHICGGSILSDQWILTAAHCFLDLPKFVKFQIVAGMFDIKNSKGQEKWQKIKVAKYIVHENFDGSGNDIALVKLERPLMYNEFVKPVALPTKDSKTKGVTELAGWGSTHPDPFKPVNPSILQMAELPIVDFQTCFDAVEAFADEHHLAETNICTGPLTGGLSPCVGDSGGPLVQRTSSGVVQRGIVSWGLAPCGSVGSPAVYTDVANFIDWISKTQKNN